MACKQDGKQVSSHSWVGESGRESEDVKIAVEARYKSGEAWADCCWMGEGAQVEGIGVTTSGWGSGYVGCGWLARCECPRG